MCQLSMRSGWNQPLSRPSTRKTLALWRSQPEKNRQWCILSRCSSMPV
ncbi:hypothetical protein [Oscillatoria sp. HE19RPO]|nr:hypothetical protein [Oscillatoria sp. HE19RPO]